MRALTPCLVVLLSCSAPKDPPVVDTEVDTEVTDTVEPPDTEDTPVDTDAVDSDVDDTDMDDTDVEDTDVDDTDAPVEPPDCTRPTGFAPVFASERAQDPLGMMMSVWGSASDDVWIVGGQKNGDGFVLRGVHDAFVTVPLPADTPMLNWVHGTSATDVWVGGVGGTLRHHDGTGWTSHDLPETGAVWGVHARAADDVLAVGGPFFGVGESFAWRFDGTTWSPLTVPTSVTGSLFKATGTDEGYVVVGQGGVGLVVDALPLRTVATTTTDDMVTVASDRAGCQQPVAVGGTFGGSMWRFEDATLGFTDLDTAFLKLNGVSMLPDGSFVAVGDRGSVGWWDATTTTWNMGTGFTQDLLHATWVAPDGSAYAVGGNFLTSGDTFHGSLGFAPAP